MDLTEILLLSVMFSWWFVCNRVYLFITSRAEFYYRADDLVIDDIYTAIAVVGMILFLWLAPIMLA